MRMKPLLLLVVCSLFTFAHALYLKKPLRPNVDPFYAQPDDLDLYEPGDIIDQRPAPLMIRAFYYALNVKNAWQYKVRSTDSRGNATAIVTTIIEPYDADPRKVLSYQYAEDASNVTCGPSYSILYGATMDSLEIQVESYLMETALSRGWYVVVPDYEGFRATFTVGKSSGLSTLDSVRAALLSSNTTGIDPDAEVAMWGYSGGSIATSWAATLQPKYAPELKPNLIGAAFGGWATNVTATAVVTEGTLYAGLIPMAIHGLLHEYPEYEDLLYGKIRHSKLDKFIEADLHCFIPTVFNYAFTKFFEGSDSVFENGWDLFKMKEVEEIVDLNTLALQEEDGYPEIPLFLFHALNDEIVPYVSANRAYENFCRWGIDSFEMSVSNTSGHILEALEGSGAAIKWLEDRFDGKETVKGCSKTFRTTNLDYPGADNGVFWLILSMFEGFDGEKLGLTDSLNATAGFKSEISLSLISKLLGWVGVIPFKA